MDEELNNESQEVYETDTPIEKENNEYIDEEVDEGVETEQSEVEEEPAEEEKITYDEEGLQKLADANKALQDLNQYTIETDNADRYEYDNIEEMWHDKVTNEYYDERPALEKTKVFDTQRFYIDKTQQEIHNIKQQIVNNTENEMIDMLNKSLGDIKDNLPENLYEVLKRDTLGPLAKQFAEDLLDDVVDGEYIIDLKNKCKEAIDERMSLYNLRGQAQDNINDSHEFKYPLESQSPTSISGEVNSGTWDNKSKKDINDWKQKLADFLSGGKR